MNIKKAMKMNRNQKVLITVFLCLKAEEEVDEAGTGRSAGAEWSGSGEIRFVVNYVNIFRRGLNNYGFRRLKPFAIN